VDCDFAHHDGLDGMNVYEFQTWLAEIEQHFSEIGFDPDPEDGWPW